MVGFPHSSSIIAFLNNHDFGGFEFVSSGRTGLFTSWNLSLLFVNLRTGPLRGPEGRDLNTSTKSYLCGQRWTHPNCHVSIVRNFTLQHKNESVSKVLELWKAPDSWCLGKESACSTGDPSSVPGWGRSPVEGNGYPTNTLAWRVPCTEAGYSSWCRKKSDTTNWLTLSLSNLRKTLENHPAYPLHFKSEGFM